MRDRLLDFELALDERSNEEVVEYDWGRAFLSPTLPLAWDANWVLIERAGMTAADRWGSAPMCVPSDIRTAPSDTAREAAQKGP